MTVTKTFEPLRPLQSKKPDSQAEVFKGVFGGWRGFYGESHWPSYSYRVFEFSQQKDG